MFLIFGGAISILSLTQVFRLLKNLLTDSTRLILNDRELKLYADEEFKSLNWNEIKTIETHVNLEMNNNSTLAIITTNDGLTYHQPLDGLNKEAKEVLKALQGRIKKK